ncbi:MAG: tetratricopeptide repeat protein [Tunicatimonas sp.]
MNTLIRTLIISLLTSISLAPVLAQRYVSEVSPVNHFQQGIELLDKKKYGAARVEFENYLQQQPGGAYASEAEYYAAYSAVRLYNPDGEAKLADFVRNHPSDPKALRANYELGNFYFRDGDYGKAIEAFEATDARNLSRTDEATRDFKLAYAYFTRQKFEEARPLFDNIKRTDNVYQSAASYYAGYIASREGNYEQALEDLRRSEREESYARVTPYLIASVFSKQGEHDRVIDYGKKMLARAESDGEAVANAAEIGLLVGNAYYEQKSYEQAEPYLADYVATQSPTQDVLYRLAYAQYQTGELPKALDNFKRVASSKDSLGQHASYYLGVLYAKQDNPEYAAPAFETAASRPFSPEIQEQAAYQLGKVYLASGDYARTLQTLQKFRETYPNSRYQVEVNDLMSEAYLNSQNYAEAMQFIESLSNKTQQVRRDYQQVSFLAGTQAFNRSRYPQAVQLFKKSTEYPIDPTYVAAANFWAGEAFSIGKRYAQAIEAYRGVMDALRGQRLEGEKAMYYTKAKYGLGYAYFNTKEYAEARTHFEEYLRQVALRGRDKDEYFYDDALVRLADTYYVTKAYDRAIDTYDRAIRERNPDIAYAYYQKGVIQGIQGRYAPGIDNLERVVRGYPDSPYRDDAMLQKAQLSFEQGNYNAAIAGFTQLIKSSPQSNLVPYALVRRALAYSNQQQYAAASNDYKQILDNHSTHKTANSALLGLQEVSSKGGGGAEFSRYLAKYKAANPENENVASIEYETAKNLYFSQDYDAAIEQLNNFINNYPQHSSVGEARYYIGESYYRAERSEQALEVFYQVEADGQYPRMGRVMERIAELEQAAGNLANAIVYYQKLANLARNKKEQYAAWSGLMTSYYTLAQNNRPVLDSVDKYAELIIERGNVSASAVNQALLYQGKAAYEQGNTEAARRLLTRTVEAAKDENGAEAQYLLARMLYDEGKHNESIEALYELNKNFSIYEDWLGQSFLLVADNYVALDETFQAEATLNSVIENSPVTEVVDEAKRRLQTLNNEERERQRDRQADSLASEADAEIIVEDTTAN